MDCGAAEFLGMVMSEDLSRWSPGGGAVCQGFWKSEGKVRECTSPRIVGLCSLPSSLLLPLPVVSGATSCLSEMTGKCVFCTNHYQLRKPKTKATLF